jgi:hypothetical protein
MDSGIGKSQKADKGGKPVKGRIKSHQKAES